MKRKLFALLLAFAMLLCACGTTGGDDQTATTAHTEATVQETEAPQVKEVFTAADMVGIDHTEKNIVFNNVDFSQQPHFTNQLGMHDYFLDCIANRCRNILFSCDKSAMPELHASDFCEKYLLAWCNPKMEPGDNGIHYMISITYYPGDNVAWAYLNNDKSTLTEDELVLYDVATAWLEENITGDMTDYEKCAAIYGYLSGNVQYSTELLNALNTSYSFDRGITAYGAMVDNLTICQGYADAFDMLTSMLGMNCCQIYGLDGSAPHNWNMIQLDGNWYHVDCTRGAAFGGADGTVSWAYLFSSDAQLGRTHSWNREAFPDATDDSLYYYNYYDLYVTNEEELEAKVGQKLAMGEQVDVYIKNLNQKQVKDYVEGLGAQFRITEHANDVVLCAWMPK